VFFTGKKTGKLTGKKWSGFYRYGKKTVFYR